MEDDIHDRPSVVSRFFTRMRQDYQRLLDYWTPYPSVRWGVTVLFGFIYILRILMIQGFYIITYALGIYHLNLFIAFLTPKIDPGMELDSDDEGGPSLPTKLNEEFRPFMRRLPEFKFWYSATKGIVIAFLCTWFEFFNIPVFWPILVMYFIILFCLTMKRQIKHMIKYRYIPFTTGKPRHKGRGGEQNHNVQTVPANILGAAPTSPISGYVPPAAPPAGPSFAAPQMVVQ